MASIGEPDRECWVPSRRTRTLLVVFGFASAVFLTAATALILSLVGNIFFGWQHAPVPTMFVYMIYSSLAVLAMRATLNWSIKRDGYSDS